MRCFGIEILFRLHRIAETVADEVEGKECDGEEECGKNQLPVSCRRP